MSENPYAPPANEDDGLAALSSAARVGSVRGGPTTFCRVCGDRIPFANRRCPHCGRRQSGGKGRITAGLLALFTGGLGLHRLYLGQWWGLVYFLFCWTGVPLVVGIIEGVRFLTTDQRRWLDRYGERDGLGWLIGGLVVMALAVSLAQLLGVWFALSSLQGLP